MKTPAIRKLRGKLAADQPVYGLWITLESPSITEMAVALGVDWIVIDAEHGHLDWKEIVEHIRAAVRSDTVVLVRVAELSLGLIKRAPRSWGRRGRGALDGVGRAVAAGRGAGAFSAGGRARHRRRTGNLLGTVLRPAHPGSQRARSGGADHRVGPRGQEHPIHAASGRRGHFLLRPSRLLLLGRLSRAVGRARRSRSIAGDQGRDPHRRQALWNRRRRQREPAGTAAARLPDAGVGARCRVAAPQPARRPDGGRPGPEHRTHVYAGKRAAASPPPAASRVAPPRPRRSHHGRRPRAQDGDRPGCGLRMPGRQVQRVRD